MTDLAQLLSELVAIDSVNPDLVPGGAGEGEIAAFIADWLTKAGLEVQIQETAPGRPNVIGHRPRHRRRPLADAQRPRRHRRPRRTGRRPDPPNRGQPPLRPRVVRHEGQPGRDHARRRRDRPPSRSRGDVIVTAVTDEEYASIGTQAIARDYTADAAIVTEPTDLETMHRPQGLRLGRDRDLRRRRPRLPAARGRRRDRQDGPGAHRAGRPRPPPPRRPSSPAASRPPPSTPRLIEGGIELSTYPDRCRLQIERRTIPGETAEQVEAELQEIVRAAGEGDTEFRADVRMGIVREPFSVGEDSESGPSRSPE